MAKSTSSLASCSSASSTSSSSNSASSTSGSLASLSTRCSTSDKALRLKTSSSIDRRKRLAANARERKRMHLLNKAYDELRQRLADAENKSKYDVLVQAKEYIQALATLCEKFDREHPERASQLEHKIQSAPVDMTYNPAAIRSNPEQSIQQTSQTQSHNHRHQHLHTQVAQNHLQLHHIHQRLNSQKSHVSLT